MTSASLRARSLATASPLLRLLCLLAATGLLSVAPASAQPTDSPTTCVIKGTISDNETGEAMPYTNIYVAGTNIGTMAFTDGYFIIRGLPPGTYTIKASYISYALGSETVTVQAGETAHIDFRLEVEAIMLDPFDVDAERRLVEIERTGSSHFLTSDQMESMPLDDVVDMIAHQPGVTIYDNEIHIRGGRADDTQFIIDGMSVNDPLAGGGYGYQIDPSIINEIEVLTGGFNAEYGQAVSGVVNVSTKEGSDRVEGKASWKRDYGFSQVPKDDFIGWRDYTVFGEPQNIDILKLSLSGPDPISNSLRRLGLDLPGEQFMLFSGAMDVRDGYLPINSRHDRLSSPVYDRGWMSPRQQNNWNGLLKWSWHITPRHKLTVTGSRQIGISQGFKLPGEGYPRPFLEGDPRERDGLDNFLVFTSENILTQVYYRQVLSENDWFEVTLGRNFNRLHMNLNGYDGDIHGDNPFQNYDLIDIPSTDPTSQAYGTVDRWHDHYSESYTFKTAYSFMRNKSNQFKTGMEMSLTEMQLVDLQSGLRQPPQGKLSIQEDIFVAHPVVGSAYFQDTINYRGLIVNAGLRGDFWAPGREVENVMDNQEQFLFIFPEMVEEFENGTIGMLGRRWKVRLSPRLGLSFPVTEQDKFFFNYGHFSQWPRFAYVYPQLQASTATKVQLLGNPTLDPKVTVEYETGIQHEFGGLWSLGVTFFNRDIYGYAKSVSLEAVDIGADETPDPNDAGTVTIQPVRYFNGDSARSLGVEFSIIKRTTRWLSGSASLELQRSTGTNSRADEAYLQTVYDEAYQPTASIGGLTRTPLLWDKPWSFSLNLDFSVFEKERPRYWLPYPWLQDSFPFLTFRDHSAQLPPNWSLNVLIRAESGQRYTPRTYRGPGDFLSGDFNSGKGPNQNTVNLRFSKYWKLGRRQKVTLFLEGRNIFNHKNFRRINSWTGDGYKVGDFNPSWSERWAQGDELANTDSEVYAKGVVDPSFIINPRVLMWGVSYSW